MGCSERDVVTVLHAGEVDALHRGVGALAGVGDGIAERRDVEHAAPGGHERAVPAGGPRVEDERPFILGVLDAADRCSRLRRLGIAARRRGRR